MGACPALRQAPGDQEGAEAKRRQPKGRRCRSKARPTRRRLSTPSTLKLAHGLPVDDHHNRSETDAERLAANGGFLLGNAHRCGIENERIVRAGELVRTLISAAVADENAEEEATARFSAFFMVSAAVDPKEEKLVASCRRVSAELRRLEKHQRESFAANIGSNKKGARPFGPGDGE